MWAFCAQTIYVFMHNTSLEQLFPSLCRDRFEVYYYPRLVECDAVCHACMHAPCVCVMYVVLLKKNHTASPLGPKRCTSALADVGWSLDKSPTIAFLLPAFFLPFFLSFFFAFAVICVFNQSAPWIHSVRKWNRRASCEIFCTKNGLYSAVWWLT